MKISLCKLNGKGKKVIRNDFILQGDFIDDILIEDKQPLRKNIIEDDYDLKNVDIYEGHFINDVLNGKGKKISACGTVSEGDFINNKLNGKGKKITSSGDIYEGNFVNDKLNGQGRFICKRGDGYEGEFVNNELNGKGMKIYVNKDITTIQDDSNESELKEDIILTSKFDAKEEVKPQWSVMNVMCKVLYFLIFKLLKYILINTIILAILFCLCHFYIENQ